ncbi:hypothetical protein V6N11_006789 [Hibiscus sabdariffa]|uniref:Uncharacterized protein n=1 Tax=Hibiscus sabdariffa TaxID=183260 RepID=A0ABR2RS63_9ROSI
MPNQFGCARDVVQLTNSTRVSLHLQDHTSGSQERQSTAGHVDTPQVGDEVTSEQEVLASDTIASEQGAQATVGNEISNNNMLGDVAEEFQGEINGQEADTCGDLVEEATCGELQAELENQGNVADAETSGQCDGVSSSALHNLPSELAEPSTVKDSTQSSKLNASIRDNLTNQG